MVGSFMNNSVEHTEFQATPAPSVSGTADTTSHVYVLAAPAGLVRKEAGGGLSAKEGGSIVVLVYSGSQGAVAVPEVHSTTLSHRKETSIYLC